MKRLLVALTKSVVKLMVRWGFAWPIAWLCARDIQTLHGAVPSFGGASINLLALSHRRFRGDLKVLDDSGRFNILIMPDKWQFRLRALFLPSEKIRNETNLAYGEDWLVGPARVQYQAFLKSFLKALYKMVPVDCVVSANYWYRQDLDIGGVSDSLGHPYVVFHRENLRTERPHLEVEAAIANRVGRFAGNCIIVHNETMRKTLVECGFAAHSQVFSLGCLRMDDFVKRVEAYRPKSGGRRRRVTFFSFSSGIGLKDLGVEPWSRHPFIGWNRLFELSHVEFARLAQKLPDVDFVIKMKWTGSWFVYIKAAFEANGIDLDEISNLSVIENADAQDLMFESDVICAFATTTILEAGLVGKPIVIPHFEEVNRKPYSERIPLRGYYDLYDIAESPEAFSELIVERLDNTDIDEGIAVKRREAFGEWISSTDADAAEKYIGVLENVVAKKSSPASSRRS